MQEAHDGAAANGPVIALESASGRRTRLRRLRSPGRTMVLCGLGVLAGLITLITVCVSVGAPDATARLLTRRTLPAMAGLQATQAGSARAQRLLLVALDTRDMTTRVTAITEAEDAGRVRDAGWATYLRLAFHRPAELALRHAYEASTRRSIAIGAELYGLAPGDPAMAMTEARNDREVARGQAILARLTARYAPVINREGQAVVSGIAATRTAAYVSYGLLAVVFVAIGLQMLRSARRDERRFHSETTALRTAARHSALETSLQRALEMESSEEAAYDIVGQALTGIVEAVPTELLVADSSRAHFRQVLSTHPETDAACRVGGPAQCPAASTGQTRVFEDSTLLDTCPFLRGHDGGVWAVCTPVSIAGHTTGVIHAEADLGTPRAPELVAALELVARKAGDRIGVLRVLARTEAQAQTDPLTGLPNRRTLENHAHDLLARDGLFVVAYADLDHFKVINDTYGHEVGDRALRVFARVLRDSVRPRDLPARYGGEEFVAVFPDCALPEARLIADRIRAKLASVLLQGSVPQFTVSIGLALADSGEAFSEVVARADAAMLDAKRLGRDRVLVAGEATTSRFAGDAAGSVEVGPSRFGRSGPAVPIPSEANRM
jgi:diguanylate cyclase (GGDEF)-like protein